MRRNEASNRGGGALSSFGGPNALGPQIALFSYDGRYSSGSDGAISFSENRMSLALPLYKTENDSIALSVNGGDFHLGAPVTLDSGFSVPEDLYRVEFGAQYFHPLPDKKMWSVKSSIGYAGATPFQDSSELTYSLNVNYGIPSEPRSYWIFSIFFSNNGLFGSDVPIPGVSYIYKTDTFTGVFGFPILSITWTPADPWLLSIGSFGPIIQSELAYGDINSVQLFSGYYWTRNTYIPTYRPSSNDRLTISEMKGGGGLRSLLLPSLLTELQMGRSFDRSIYIGDGFFNKEGGSSSVNADWYLSWSLKAKL